MILFFSENEKNKFKNNEEDLTKFIKKKSDQDLKDTLQEQLH